MNENAPHCLPKNRGTIACFVAPAGVAPAGVVRASVCSVSIGRQRRNHIAVRFAFLLLFLAGCQRAPVDDDGFGRIRSNSGYGAIDGISGFVHLLKTRGLQVRQSGRIAPSIDRFDTIIWAPDRESPPSVAAINRLQQWVDDGHGTKRVIFIGPGFRSRKLLDKKQMELAAEENLERSVRRHNEKLIQYNHYDYGYADGENCQWYKLAKIQDQPITQITGPWSSDPAVKDAELYTGNYDFKIPSALLPVSSAKNHDSSGSGNARPVYRRASVLLSGDGHNLVYRIPLRSAYKHGASYDDDDSPSSNRPANAYQATQESSGVFIVCNGSFLQNYGLVNPANQVLANRLANQCSGEVLVLQSGPSPIEVTDSLAPEQNNLRWLRQRPLREIVPFFLLLATFTFFAAFPIHGRPKRIRLRPEKTFADHIRATGQLLKSSKGRDWAKKTIQKYHDDSSDKKSN